MGIKRGRGSTEEDRRAQAELMWDDKERGLTNKQLAEKYEVSLRTVSHRLGEFPRPGSREKVDTKDYVLFEEVARMWDDRINHHLTNEELAAKYGYDVRVVQRKLQGHFPTKSRMTVEKQRLREDDKLDMLEEVALSLMNKTHYVVDKGQVVRHPDTGEPLVDSAPTFTAINSILKVIDARRKMHGLDAPVKAEVTHRAEADIQVREIIDHVDEAHRKNQERLDQIKEQLGLPAPPEEIAEAVVVEDGSAPTEES